jgi:hypothetical protein
MSKGIVVSNGCGRSQTVANQREAQGTDVLECDIVVNHHVAKSLKFFFTQAIQPPLLSSIEYTFSSGTPLGEMAKYVSSQYPNARPPKAIQQPSHGVPNCCITWKWELDDGASTTNLSLFLIQEPTMPNDPHYVLALGSSDILTRENQIIKQQQLNVNPKPKF